MFANPTMSSPAKAGDPVTTGLRFSSDFVEFFARAYSAVMPRFKRDIQQPAASIYSHQRSLRSTGSPAFAGDDNKREISDPDTPNRPAARWARGFAFSFALSIKEGAGKTGCQLASFGLVCGVWWKCTQASFTTGSTGIRFSLKTTLVHEVTRYPHAAIVIRPAISSDSRDALLRARALIYTSSESSASEKLRQA